MINTTNSGRHHGAPPDLSLDERREIRRDRRRRVVELVGQGLSTYKIAQVLNCRPETVRSDRRALGLEQPKGSNGHPEWRPQIEELTRQGVIPSEIAAHVGCCTQTVYLVQVELGARIKGQWTEAQRLAQVAGAERNREHARKRKRKQITCTHCGQPADPDCRCRGLEWCGPCLVDHGGDADPEYEVKQREEHYRGGGVTALAQAPLWAPGIRNGDLEAIHKGVDKLGRETGAVRQRARAPRGDEQEWSERQREAHKRQRLASLQPWR